jgi:DNA-binding XRE family transcriptional regulator
MIPSVLLALKLARALGISVDDLFSLSGEERFQDEEVTTDALR